MYRRRGTAGRPTPSTCGVVRDTDKSRDSPVENSLEFHFENIREWSRWQVIPGTRIL